MSVLYSCRRKKTKRDSVAQLLSLGHRDRLDTKHECTSEGIKRGKEDYRTAASEQSAAPVSQSILRQTRCNTPRPKRYLVAELSTLKVPAQPLSPSPVFSSLAVEQRQERGPIRHLRSVFPELCNCSGSRQGGLAGAGYVNGASVPPRQVCTLTSTHICLTACH